MTNQSFVEKRREMERGLALLKRTGRTSESENVYREAIDIGEGLVSRAPLVYQHELVRTLCNYAHLLSDIDSTDALQRTMTRLMELGITSLPETEEWSEEEANLQGPRACFISWQGSTI